MISAREVLAAVTIEPYLMLYFFSITLASTASAILYPVKVCLNDYKNYFEYYPYSLMGLPYNKSLHKEVCFHLEDNQLIQGIEASMNQSISSNQLLDDVQSRAAFISAMALCLQIVPAALATLIMMNIADIVGRKILFMIPICGYFVYNASFMVNWALEDMSSWFLVLEFLHEFLGGRHVITALAILYISDITPLESRTFRLNIVALIELSFSAIGTGIAGFILEANNIMGDPGEGKDYNGFYSVYGIATCLQIISIMYMMFMVKETVVETKAMSLKQAFSLTQVKETFGVTFRQRKDGSRVAIVTVVLSYLLVAMNYGGTWLSNCMYFYLQKMGWDVSQYTLFVSLNGIMVLIGCLTIINFLIGYVKIDDLTLGMIGQFAVIFGYLILLSTPYGNHWVPFIAMLANLFSGGVGTACKSYLCKLVPVEELSSVLAIFGMTLPLAALGPPLYNMIYKASIDSELCKNVEQGSKDWCTTTFLMFGVCVVATTFIIFSVLKLKFKSVHHRNEEEKS